MSLLVLAAVLLVIGLTLRVQEARVQRSHDREAADYYRRLRGEM